MNRYKIMKGDSLEKLKKLKSNSVDSVVTDPPYHLTSIVKRFGKENSAPAKPGKTGAYVRASKGFMGKTWDGGDIAQNPELWSEVFRVLKPGGFLLAFSSPRTYHKMAIAIEESGFNIRDMIQWIYATGFPKSHDISKAIDKSKKIKRKEIGERKAPGYSKKGVEQGAQNRTKLSHIEYDDTPVSKEAKYWYGWGTGLKPAQEPIVLAQKPISEKTIANNVLKWGVGAINIDISRIEFIEELDKQTINLKRSIDPTNKIVYGKYKPKPWESNKKGRFPANIIHDGSVEATENMPVNSCRYFYSAKVSKKDRSKYCTNFENKHPTVKPFSLVEYLIKLITPPEGLVLDPFMGSGTTGISALENNFKFIGIELEEEYYKICKDRIRTLIRG